MVDCRQGGRRDGPGRRRRLPSAPDLALRVGSVHCGRGARGRCRPARQPGLEGAPAVEGDSAPRASAVRRAGDPVDPLPADGGSHADGRAGAGGRDGDDARVGRSCSASAGCRRRAPGAGRHGRGAPEHPERRALRHTGRVACRCGCTPRRVDPHARGRKRIGRATRSNARGAGGGRRGHRRHVGRGRRRGGGGRRSGRLGRLLRCGRSDGRRGGGRRWRRGGRRRSCGRRGRRGNGRRDRRGGGRGRRLGRGRRRGARRKQPEWVDVALRLARTPDPEMDARHGVLRRPARAHRPDRRSLGDGDTLRDDDRPEMDERDGVAVLRLDRDPTTVRGEGSGERHDPGRGRADGRAVGAADVDAAVLAGCVGIRPQTERSQDRPVGGPRPRRSRRAEHEARECQHADDEDTVHETPPSLSARATRVEEE